MFGHTPLQVRRMAYIMTKVGVQHVDKESAASDHSITRRLTPSETLRFMPVSHRVVSPVPVDVRPPLLVAWGH